MGVVSLGGTSSLWLYYGYGKSKLDGYIKAYMTRDIDFKNLPSRYMMTFAGGAISWQSKLQKCDTLSTTKEEYIAASEACKQTLGLKKFLKELCLK